MSRLSAITLIFLLFCPTAFAGGKKPPPLQLGFHLQGSVEEGEKRVFPQSIAGQDIYFQKSPIISQKDVIAFRPFPAEDQVTYGLIFQLKGTPAKRLQSICNANPQRYLLAMMNGQVRDAVIIDRAPTDSFIVIWQKVSATEIRVMDRIMPRIGQDTKEWKKNLKKK